ncbi:MAG: hypothetical protein M3R51_09490 [Candidatus Eremiobacteraeota bacterium]|nr:hypothetical protein [Candidatus Eremiobacteraeota bacterium]
MPTTVSWYNKRVDEESAPFFAQLAQQYIWWKAPGDPSLSRERIIAQVMDIGDFDDMLALRKVCPDDTLRAVLMNADAGWFSPRSWKYWHLVLRLISPGESAPPPVKRAIRTL